MALSDPTVTRKDLCYSAYERCRKLSRREIKRLVDETIEEIIAELAEGKSVKLKGLGTFSVRSKADRPGRNPKTGEPALIARRRVVTFKPSNLLRAKMKHP